MSSHDEQNTLSSDDRDMLIKLLGWITRKMESKGVDIRDEIYKIYSKLN